MATIKLVLDNNPMGVYMSGRSITGNIRIDCKEKIQHSGLTVNVEGKVSMQLPTKNMGVLEVLYNELKPLELINNTVVVQKTGAFNTGVMNVPFTIDLKRKDKGPPLFETFHGLFINVQYTLTAELDRGRFAKNARDQIQILIQNPGQHVPDTIAPPTTVVMTPSTHKVELMQGSKKKNEGSGKFRITCTIDTTTVDVQKPLTGSISVDHSDMPIRSIEMHLCRVETCISGEKTATETTYVQNTQVAFGNVCRQFEIPLYLVPPRLLTCPTLDTAYLKAEFQVNVAVVFENELTVENSFPLLLFRPGATQKEDLSFEIANKKKAKPPADA